VWISDCS